jgi:hypothetical protein
MSFYRAMYFNTLEKFGPWFTIGYLAAWVATPSFGHPVLRATVYVVALVLFPFLPLGIERILRWKNSRP